MCVSMQEETAKVVSTVLLVSGLTTLLHISFGSRLPLIQGPSFVYLAPVLAIINSPELQALNGNVCMAVYIMLCPTKFCSKFFYS
jgi:xanthine/uracil permease